jgi:hypothetical protein
MVMQGRRLSRTQVLAWNEPWSTRDRVWITAALDAIPNGVCVVPRAGDRIGVWMDGRLALVIRPGYLSWPGGQWATAGPVPGNVRGRALQVARAVHLPATHWWTHGRGAAGGHLPELLYGASADGCVRQLRLRDHAGGRDLSLVLLDEL